MERKQGKDRVLGGGGWQDTRSIERKEEKKNKRTESE